METTVLRVRLTNNIKQLQKYINEAVSKGAETIHFDVSDWKNQYFLFNSAPLPEDVLKAEIKETISKLQSKLDELQNTQYITRSFRVKLYLSVNDLEEHVSDFVTKNCISDNYMWDKRQAITDAYDDFNDGTETVYVTDVIRK